MSIIKSSIFTSLQQMQKHRAYIEQAQLKQMWENQPLTRLQELLTIRDHNIITYLYSFIEHYVNERRSLSEAYFTQKNNDNLLFYDCKIFKSPRFTKEENQMICSFLVVMKSEGSTQFDRDQVFEFADIGTFKDSNAIIKCKLSSILKIPGLIRALKLEPINGDTIILRPDEYYKFMWNWMQYCPSHSHEQLIKYLFLGLMLLVQNNLMLAFYDTLTPSQKNDRRYKKPVSVIMKPKLRQSSTMIESGCADVKWHRLRVEMFKLKYNVQQSQQKYLCFRSPTDDEQLLWEDQLIYDDQYLQPGDRNILECFERLKIRWAPIDYY